MKSIKDFNWKNWVVVYLIFAILLGMISALFKTDEGMSIIPTGFIFTTVLLLHFLKIVRNQEGARMKRLVMAFIALIIIQTAVSEFYGKPLAVFGLDILRTALAALLVLFVISYIVNKVKDKRIAKEKVDEVVSQAPEEKEIDIVKPEEVPGEKPKEEEDAKTEDSR